MSRAVRFRTLYHVVSWNFRHMVNIDRKRRINSGKVRDGYPLFDLVSPWETPSLRWIHRVRRVTTGEARRPCKRSTDRSGG